MSDDRVVSMGYWLDRAEESHQEAELMAASAHWNTCVNRLYQACFYAVKALLLQRGLTASRHTGVRSLFNREFVRTGVVSHDFAALYNGLFDNRREADYLAMVTFTERDVCPWLSATRRFFGEILKMLK